MDIAIQHKIATSLQVGLRDNMNSTFEMDKSMPLKMQTSCASQGLCQTGTPKGGLNLMLTTLEFLNKFDYFKML